MRRASIGTSRRVLGREPAGPADSRLIGAAAAVRVQRAKSPLSLDPEPGISMSPGRLAPELPGSRRKLTTNRGEEKLMRRASICLAVMGLALMALTGVASAAPEVTFKAQAVPIPGYPETGNIYGAGSAVQAEYTIKGTEYVGSPPPLAGINFFLPKGTKLHTAGFKTCPLSELEPTGKGPGGCPKSSHAGPTGEALGYVSLGGERVHESISIESFYAPGGGVEFFAFGHTPVNLEILSKGHYVHLGGGGGFGPELETEIPLVASVPGAPYASTETIKVKAGSAYGPKNPKKAVYYGRVPKKGQCPKGGFKIKTEVIFAEVGGLPRQTVTKEYRAPCPRRSVKK
jgi:hypothetical protein